MGSDSLSRRERFLRFLQQLYAIGTELDVTRRILAGLPELIAADNVMIGQHDAGRRQLKGILLRHPFTMAHFLPEANTTGLIGKHPFWDRILDEEQPLKVLSEMQPARKWRENPFYREMLMADRVEEHINIEFGEDPACFTTVGLIRSRRGFSARDRELLLLLRPHIVQALDNARQAELNGLVPGFNEGGGGRVIEIPDCHLGRGLDPRTAGRVSLALCGNGRELPTALRDWLVFEINRFHRGMPDHLAQPFRLWVKARLFELRLCRRWPGPTFFLVIRVADGNRRNLRLSLRESEVLSHVRAGRSNAEISVLLNISIHTVRDHLKHAYAKLGVTNRAAAARLPQPH